MPRCCINVRELAAKGGSVTLRLDDGFFAAFGGDDIVGGDVEIAASAREAVGEASDYRVDMTLRGTLRVTCTRCLGVMETATELRDAVAVVCGGNVGADADELLCAEAGGELDLSLRVYETLALSLPSVHTHPDGECDPLVTKWMEAPADGNDK